MATFLSSPSPAGSRATPGERRFADRLRDLLEDDYLCWYDVPVGPRHQHPDFLVLHPARGLLILEVKDWHLKTIRDADPVRFTIDTRAGHKVVPNPLEQARQYTFAVTDLLKRLFPELRIHQQALEIDPADQSSLNATPADLLQVMDLAQEEIARNLGEGHRVIHGVAGSGKTLILAYRCRHLARTLQKPILVLVFNRSLAAWLRHQFDAQGLGAAVTVRTFHGWCADQLRLYHVPQPQGGGYEQMVEAVIRAVDRGQIPRTQYGAVLIDEGHDFAPDWLKLAVQMLDPATNHLLLLYDDAQSIYGEKRAKSFSFRSLGIEAAGRTKILRRNYRNTREILTCARTFAGELLSARDTGSGDIPLLYPETGDRSGARPRFSQLASMKQEAEHIGRELLAQHAAGVSWNEMGVFYTAPFVADEIAAQLAAMNIPFDWLRDAASKSIDPSRPTVKLMTPHSSKGLQYRVVIIGGVGFWPYPTAQQSEPDQARLLYVAMTRATHELVVTSSRGSRFSERLKSLCGQA